MQNIGFAPWKEGGERDMAAEIIALRLLHRVRAFGAARPSLFYYKAH